MKMGEVQKKAKSYGLKAAKIKKVDLIKSIQVHEGYFPCFQTAGDYCDQDKCCWRDDCLTH